MVCWSWSREAIAIQDGGQRKDKDRLLVENQCFVLPSVLWNCWLSIRN